MSSSSDPSADVLSHAVVWATWNKPLKRRHSAAAATRWNRSRVLAVPITDVNKRSHLDLVQNAPCVCDACGQRPAESFVYVCVNGGNGKQYCESCRDRIVASDPLHTRECFDLHAIDRDDGADAKKTHMMLEKEAGRRRDRGLFVGAVITDAKAPDGRRIPPMYRLLHRAGAEPYTGDDLVGETSLACMRFANVISKRAEPVCDHSPSPDFAEMQIDVANDADTECCMTSEEMEDTDYDDCSSSSSSSSSSRSRQASSSSPRGNFFVRDEQSNKIVLSQRKRRRVVRRDQDMPPPPLEAAHDVSPKREPANRGEPQQAAVPTNSANGRGSKRAPICIDLVSDDDEDECGDAANINLDFQNNVELRDAVDFEPPLSDFARAINADRGHRYGGEGLGDAMQRGHRDLHGVDRAEAPMQRGRRDLRDEDGGAGGDMQRGRKDLRENSGAGSDMRQIRRHGDDREEGAIQRGHRGGGCRAGVAMHAQRAEPYGDSAVQDGNGAQRIEQAEAVDASPPPPPRGAPDSEMENACAAAESGSRAAGEEESDARASRQLQEERDPDEKNIHPSLRVPGQSPCSLTLEVLSKLAPIVQAQVFRDGVCTTCRRMIGEHPLQ